MMTHHSPARCATAAIAAVLALGSTALVAQTVDPLGQPFNPQPAQTQPAQPQPVQSQPSPSLVAPPPATPVPSASTVPGTNASPVLPVPSPSAIVPEQIVVPEAPSQASGATAVPAPAARAADPEPAAVPRTEQPARRSIAASASAPESATTETLADAEPLPTELEPVFVPPVDLDPIDVTADETIEGPLGPPDLLDMAVYFLGVLLVLAVVVFILRRPRKLKRYASAKPRTAPQPALRETAAPATPVIEVATVASPIAAPPAGTRNPLRGPAVPLPRKVPHDFAERDALLRRMIAAQPDRANPFRSPKARLHRARLIIQSIGRDFGNIQPWIDLSDYPDVWPELARRRYPHAA